VRVGLAVVADERGRGVGVGAEDGTGDQVADSRAGGGVDGVAILGGLVVVGRAEQEHLVHAVQDAIEGGGFGQVGLDRVHAVPGGRHGPDHGSYR